MWNTIDTTDVLNELTPAEQAQLQNIQGGTGQLPAIIDKTVRRVRSLIKAGGNMLDESATTIPDQLAEETIAIARWKWLGAFPGLKTLKTEERRQAHAEAQALLKEIASNKPERPRVELPMTPDGVAAPTNAVAVVRRGRAVRTRSFDRLTHS